LRKWWQCRCNYARRNPVIFQMTKNALNFSERTILAVLFPCFWITLGCKNTVNQLHSGTANASISAVSDSVYSLMIMQHGDSLLRQIDKKRILVYATTSKDLVAIKNDTWPDSVITTINLIEVNNRPLVYSEIPHSESGDWNNVYTYYFDTAGNTRAIRISSSFFNSVCVEGVLTETTTLLFSSKFTLLAKQYDVRNDKGLPITDTTNCAFNYRYPYPQYKKYSLTILGQKLDSIKKNYKTDGY
jgi:hypothetical protein